MKIFRYSTVFLLIVTFLTSAASGAERIDSKNTPALAKTAVASTGQFSGNRVRTDLENNGMVVSQRISGHSGMEWPKDNHTYSVYASGVWLAGKVNGQIRTAVAEYGPERVPGPYGGDPNSGDNKLFIVSKSDLADPLANDDFQNWPTHLGAPWVDNNGNGSYEPLPNGPDHPEFLGDQVVWYVSNDGDPTGHSIFGTAPMGVEVQTTIFGFDRPDAFGDMIFVKELVINKGEDDIDDTYIGVWSDPDLGDAGDDFVGCDTTLGLGICYNDGNDVDYAGFSGGIPAVGYDFFQGPIVPSAGDTAFAQGRHIPGYKNLSMTSFSKYINSSDPVWSDPNDQIEMYNLMQGLMKDGSEFAENLTGGSKFVHPGDPTLNTGPTDTEYVDSDVHASDDRRFLMNAGPFTLAVGDTQEVVFGILHAAAGNALDSYLYLKQVDALAQLAYDIQFALPESPGTPEVNASTLADNIVLTWDDAVESYTALDVIDKMPVPVEYDTTWVTDIEDVITSTSDTLIVGTDTTITVTYDTTFNYIQVVDFVDTTFAGEDTRFKFEGYNVYQLETASGSGERKLIATYDLINGITEIYDDVFDPNFGETINRRVQFGSDSGVKRNIRIDQDALNNNAPLKTNRLYYFAVTAYGYNPYGIPRTLESPMNIIAIRPQVPTGWAENDTTAAYGDSYTADHNGGSDGYVTVTVADPQLLVDDTYTVTFASSFVDAGDTVDVINWSVTNSAGDLLVANNTIQSGVDFATGLEVGYDANPTVDGLTFTVTGAPDDLKSVSVVANNTGPLPSPVDGLAYWYFPSYLVADGDYTNQQVTTDAIWFLNTGPMYGVDEDAFMGSVFQYTGGYGHPGMGVGTIVPDDFEVRFTGNGKALDWWDDEHIMDVPFEWWNIGDASDPSDDYQLIPYVLDEDGNDDWNLQFGSADADHGTSGGANDPWTDRVYVMSPTDDTPGTQGYDNFLAALPGATPGWYYGPGDNDAGGPLDAWITFARTTFMIWNGGDVTTASSPADYSAESPEIGTVFRITTTKPNTVNDSFTFSTSSILGDDVTYDPSDINVWPNPYFGFNPEERNPVERQMTFTHLPGTDCEIRIFDLSGVPVRLLKHDDGTQFETWDLTNNYGIPVASGMYLAHIKTDEGEKVLKIAVIMPEQRLDVY